MKTVNINSTDKLKIFTSAHAFGRTKRPIRPASLALSIFSKSGTMVEFGLEHTINHG